MESPPPVVVTVYGNPQVESCQACGWGPSRSSSETTLITRKHLDMRHGSRVRIEYVDLGEPEAGEEHAGVLRRVAEEGLPYPLVAVNGALRLAGSAHYSHVLPLVDEALSSRMG